MLCEVHILIAETVPFLGIGDGVILGALELNPGDLIIGEVLIMLHQVVQGSAILIQGVVLGQIHIAVPDGDIALRIHVAVIPQSDCMPSQPLVKTAFSTRKPENAAFDKQYNPKG